VIALLDVARQLLTDVLRFAAVALRPARIVAAENLFLRRQLALYQERAVKPRRPDVATRLSLALWSRLFDWRASLVVVRPETLIRWHRAGFRLLWRFKSRPGRPAIPVELRQLIRRMAAGWVEDWRAGVGRGLDSLFRWLIAVGATALP
jgi:putative transposase